MQAIVSTCEMAGCLRFCFRFFLGSVLRGLPRARNLRWERRPPGFDSWAMQEEESFEARSTMSHIVTHFRSFGPGCSLYFLLAMYVVREKELSLPTRFPGRPDSPKISGKLKKDFPTLFNRLTRETSPIISFSAVIWKCFRNVAMLSAARP